MKELLQLGHQELFEAIQMYVRETKGRGVLTLLMCADPEGKEGMFSATVELKPVEKSEGPYR